MVRLEILISLDFKPKYLNLRPELRLLQLLIRLKQVLPSLNKGQQWPFAHTQVQQPFLIKPILTDKQSPQIGQIRLRQILTALILNPIPIQIQSKQRLQIRQRKIITPIIPNRIMVQKQIFKQPQRHLLNGLKPLTLYIIMAKHQSFQIADRNASEQEHELCRDHVVGQMELFEFGAVFGVVGEEVFAGLVDVCLVVQLEAAEGEIGFDQGFGVLWRGLGVGFGACARSTSHLLLLIDITMYKIKNQN